MFPISPLSRNAKAFTLPTPITVCSTETTMIAYHFIRSRARILYSQNTSKSVPIVRSTISVCSFSQRNMLYSKSRLLT